MILLGTKVRVTVPGSCLFSLVKKTCYHAFSLGSSSKASQNYRKHSQRTPYVVFSTFVLTLVHWCSPYSFLLGGSAAAEQEALSKVTPTAAPLTPMDQ